MENEGSPSVITNESSEGIRGWIESVVITASQTSVGQALFKLLDSFLWVVEKSAQWSLPSHEVAAEENGKVFGKIELVRPLPWVLFLPGLVILRIIRVGLNVGAFVLGYPKIQPSGMVKFVQKGRRRLRAFNLKAVKSVRRTNKYCLEISNWLGTEQLLITKQRIALRATSNKEEGIASCLFRSRDHLLISRQRPLAYFEAILYIGRDKRLTMIEAKKALIRSIRLTLSTLSCLDTSQPSPSPPPTKIRISNMDLEPVATPDEKSTTESVGSPIHTKIKRKFSEVSSDEESTDESENETLQTKLERLALESSTDDPDFNPTECSTESSSENSENEVEKEMCLNELVEVREEANEFCNGDEKPVIVSLENLKTNSTKEEEMEEEAKHVDSSESKLETVSRITNEFINGEICSTIDTRSTEEAPKSEPEPEPEPVPEPVPVPALPSVPVPAPAPAPEVIEKVSPKKSPVQVPSHSRNFIAKENSSTIPERKGNKHKKSGRRETK